LTRQELGFDERARTVVAVREGFPRCSHQTAIAPFVDDGELLAHPFGLTQELEQDDATPLRGIGLHGDDVLDAAGTGWPDRCLDSARQRHRAEEPSALRKRRHVTY